MAKLKWLSAIDNEALFSDLYRAMDEDDVAVLDEDTGILYQSGVNSMDRDLMAAVSEFLAD